MTLQEKLQANTIALFSSLDSLTQIQAEFKSSPTSWSILECAEHIFLVDKAVYKSISTPIPETVENDKTELFGEGKLNHLLVNKREFKVVAPVTVSPTNHFKTLEETKQNINAIIDLIIDYIDTHKIEEETLTIKHARLGEMTKVDWIHFLISHTNRHILQIEEVKSLV
jgi:hypothetical protein